MMESAGGRSVAVDISDRWKVTCEMWHATCDIWLKTCDTWFFFSSSKRARKVTISAKKKGNKWLKSSQKCQKVSQRPHFIVFVLLSTQIERVGVSCMQDFFPSHLLNNPEGLIIKSKYRTDRRMYYLETHAGLPKGIPEQGSVLGMLVWAFVEKLILLSKGGGASVVRPSKCMQWYSRWPCQLQWHL